jgi:uncharacterized protein (DUF1330 family)
MAGSEIYMLNALWFKPDGGAEKYSQYMKAAAPFVQKYGGRMVTGALVPDKPVIGEFDADLVFFVRYPDWESFTAMINDREYLTRAAVLREEALERSLLIRCTPR